MEWWWQQAGVVVTAAAVVEVAVSGSVRMGLFCNGQTLLSLFCFFFLF